MADVRKTTSYKHFVIFLKPFVPIFLIHFFLWKTFHFLEKYFFLWRTSDYQLQTFYDFLLLKTFFISFLENISFFGKHFFLWRTSDYQPALSTSLRITLISISRNGHILCYIYETYIVHYNIRIIYMYVLYNMIHILFYKMSDKYYILQYHTYIVSFM